MAQYKVPQDVEADDKLLGPFSPRQLVFLGIAIGAGALAWFLFTIFPLLAIIPVPIVIFFGALALPLKKDQPMEAYVFALIRFYFKPNKRIWFPGQRESTILITAPKIVEQPRSRDITGSEASHRLSFLADIVDSEGQAIKGNYTSIKDEFVAEANSTTDIFDSYQAQNIDRIISNDAASRHATAVNNMKAAIERAESINSMPSVPLIQKHSDNISINHTPEIHSDTIIQPTPVTTQSKSEPTPTITPIHPPKPATTPAPQSAPAPKPAIQELANNSDYSVQTIAKEANRINNLEEKEVFISLH